MPKSIPKNIPKSIKDVLDKDQEHQKHQEYQEQVNRHAKIFFLILLAATALFCGAVILFVL